MKGCLSFGLYSTATSCMDGACCVSKYCLSMRMPLSVRALLQILFALPATANLWPLMSCGWCLCVHEGSAPSKPLSRQQNRGRLRRLLFTSPASQKHRYTFKGKKESALTPLRTLSNASSSQCHVHHCQKNVCCHSYSSQGTGRPGRHCTQTAQFLDALKNTVQKAGPYCSSCL